MIFDKNIITVYLLDNTSLVLNVNLKLLVFIYLKILSVVIAVMWQHTYAFQNSAIKQVVRKIFKY